MDERTIEWLERAKEWAAQITAKPKWGDDLGKDVADAEAHFVYFSPYRPLDFVSSITGKWFVICSTDEFKDFLYCSQPLPLDRIVAWQLLPMSPAAVESAWSGVDMSAHK